LESKNCHGECCDKVKRKKNVAGTFFCGSAKVAVAVAGEARYRLLSGGLSLYRFIAKSTFKQPPRQDGKVRQSSIGLGPRSSNKGTVCHKPVSVNI
jgi:hypothetical protein